jgi:hemoglobin
MSRSDLTPQSIAVLVDRFCERAAADPELAAVCGCGPDGEGAGALHDFWIEALLGGARHDGDPFGHVPVPPDHPLFERWLALFRDTADEVYTPDLAALFARKAERLADSLRTGMWFTPGGRRRPCIRLIGE